MPKPGDEMIVLERPVSNSICLWNGVMREEAGRISRANIMITLPFHLFSYNSLCSRRVFECLEGLAILRHLELFLRC